MTTPTAEFQLEFLSDVQRLLAEGQYTATYKFALLLALADLAVESPGEGDRLLLPLSAIAEKIIFYYWGHVRPYVPLGEDEPLIEMLSQNTGKQAAVLRSIKEFQGKMGGSLSQARTSRREWGRLVSTVRRVVLEMPLWKLQRIGGEVHDFLYEQSGEEGTLYGDRIELKPGVAYCLRRFHGLIGELVRGAWLGFVRRQNLDALRVSTDLEEFLFGTKRRVLEKIAPVLQQLQRGLCFYCERPVKQQVDVDHFIPWSRYAVDLGHNFVLAHAACNRSKSDHIACVPHLERWLERNATHDRTLSDEIAPLGISCDFGVSRQVTTWAYEQAELIGERGWERGDIFQPIGRAWRSAMGLSPG